MELNIFGYPLDIYEVDKTAQKEGSFKIPVLNGFFPLSATPDAEDLNFPGWSVGYGKYEIVVLEKHKPGRATFILKTKCRRIDKPDESPWHSRELSKAVDLGDSVFMHTETVAQKILQETAILCRTIERFPETSFAQAFESAFDLLHCVGPERFEGVSERAVTILARVCATSRGVVHFAPVPNSFSANQLAAFVLATGRLPIREKENKFPERR